MDNEEIAENKLQKLASTGDLDLAIKRLERKKLLQEEDLKDHIHNILESLKPTNILKHTIHEVQESTPLKHNLLKLAVGLGAGYFSRKMVVGKSAGILKKALGTALQFGVTQFVAKKNADIDDDDVYRTEPKKKSLLKRVLSI